MSGEGVDCEEEEKEKEIRRRVHECCRVCAFGVNDRVTWFDAKRTKQ